MQLSRHFVEAISNLLSTKLRTFLAVLGVLVGTASVVAMVSGGKLATRQALLQFKELGTNLLSIEINSSQSGAQSDVSTDTDSLTLPMVLGIQKVSPAIQLIAPYTSVYVPATFNGNNLNASILGVTQSMQPVMKISMYSGRFISFLDTYENYCVIGQDIYQTIKQYTLNDPIGQQINANGTYYTIIGVENQWTPNSFIYADLNNAILVPLSSSLTLSKYAEINSIILRVDPHASTTKLQNAITDYFDIHAPGKQLYFQSAKQIIQSMQKQQEILTVFLGFIGSISLLVGGIGVMNIMLVSVTERRREIGIRLAIGAHRRDIRLMFLIEAIVLSFFGGLIGVLLGIFISFIIAEVKGWQFTLFLLPPMIGFGVSVFTGVFFGYYPAYKASKLDPIQTLRMD